MKNFISRGVFFTLTTGLLFILLNLLTQTNVYAQKTDNLWTDVPGNAVAAKGIRLTIPQKYRTLSLNVNGMRGLLAQAPHEKSTSLRSSTAIVTLPLPDGKSARFRFVENSTMAPDLAARFPEIRTYTGVGVDDRSLTATFDFTPAGFHGMIHSAENGLSFIDPYSQGDIDNYIVYAKKDYVPGENKKFIEVGVIGENSEIAKKIAERVAQKKNQRMAAQGNATSDRPSGDQLRTYRAAIAATAEYTAFHGGTVSNALAAINTTLNRVNFIYIREVAIKMQLVSNETNIIYTSNPDPYSNGNAYAMMDENQSNINAQIGSGNYDIGHVFGTNSGGVAYLGVVCDAGYKARGVTGSSSPTGDAFDVDMVAHEMGHQFGADHTFNGNAGSCSGNGNAGTAFEPGSGSTVMSYAGICSPQNLQRNSDAYFHVASYDEIFAYSEINEGNSCAVVTSSGNTAPTPTIITTNNLTIPKQTPFTITGSATDIQNDSITYNWEQYDLGPAGSPTSPSGNAPIFRSFKATGSGSRTFPKLSDILNNTSTIGEILPTYARALKFNLTVRDNYPFGGGVDRINPLTVNVSGTAGPFLVTSPNTNISMSQGTVQAVTWDVSGTTASPINCTNVNILLSTNGGVTFPTVLVSNTTNDGSQDVLIPNIATSTARIKVEAVGNIFFDISNVNFTITGSGTPTNQLPTVSISSPANNTNYTSPASIIINASASDADGSITKVDFYNGSTLLGTDATSPYSFAWNNAAAGSYSLTAKATDNSGASSTSSAVSVTVSSATNQLPTVDISSPVNNTNYTAPANITIDASASDPDGSVSKVDFYNGTTLLGTDFTSPYSFIWTGVAEGTYVLSAKATDNSSEVGTSSSVSVTVNNGAANQLPTVSITSPLNNASFTAPALITINANATDPDGTVSKVEFYSGSTLLGTDVSSPYSFVWNSVGAGNYSLTAKATDNVDAVTTSNPVTVSVNTTAPPTITSLAPTSGTVGAGVYIRGTNFTNVSAIRFNGVAATQFYLADATSLYATVPSGATTGKIQVVAQGGSALSASNFTVGAIVSSWTTKIGMATARAQHGAIATNGRNYAFGGYNGTGLLSSIESYSPSTNTWSAGAPMPAALRGMSFALGSDSNIYVVGGEGVGGVSRAAYRYSPTGNTWTILASIPKSTWEGSAAATSNGKVYVFGGNPIGADSSTQIYDITSNTWSTGANMPTPVMQHTAVKGDDGRIYVIGGRTSSGNAPIGTVQVYNPATNTWSIGASMLIPKVQFGAVTASNGNIYVIGGKAKYGNNSGPFFHSVEIYNRLSNTWSTGPVTRAWGGELEAVNLNGNLYAIGGTNGTYRNYNFQLRTPSAAKGIGDPADLVNSLSVSPNPANKLTRISFSLDRDQKVHLLIYNMEGKVIDHLYEGNAVAGKKYQFNWNVGSNASGIYITTLRTEKAVYHQKVMVLP